MPVAFQGDKTAEGNQFLGTNHSGTAAKHKMRSEVVMVSTTVLFLPDEPASDHPFKAHLTAVKVAGWHCEQSLSLRGDGPTSTGALGGAQGHPSNSSNSSGTQHTS